MYAMIVGEPWKIYNGTQFYDIVGHSRYYDTCITLSSDCIQKRWLENPVDVNGDLVTVLLYDSEQRVRTAAVRIQIDCFAEPVKIVKLEEHINELKIKEIIDL